MWARTMPSNKVAEFLKASTNSSSLLYVSLPDLTPGFYSADSVKDKYTGHTSDRIVAMVQAATIGQTFAMLSGVRKDECVNSEKWLTDSTRIPSI